MDENVTSGADTVEGIPVSWAIFSTRASLHVGFPS
jgi:hypothetical protein